MLLAANDKTRRISVIYVYHESEDARINLEFFQRHGMLHKDSHNLKVDYFLMINGPNLSVEAHNYWSVKYRENVGFDFAAWSECIKSIDVENYDYFVFLNDTVRGPFDDSEWLTTFTNLIDEKTKLAGMSINCCTYKPFVDYYREQSIPHVQSMFWCTDQIGLKIARATVLDKIDLTKNAIGKEHVIITCELGLSYHFLISGFNITCILKEYQKDYRNKSNWLINTQNGRNGDPWHFQAYFGRNIIPTESIFFKINRVLDTWLLNNQTHLQNEGRLMHLGANEREFERIGKIHDTDKVTHHSYYRFYPRFIKQFQNDDMAMIEIGIQESKSLKMWLEYFPKGFVYGTNVESSSSGDRYLIYQTDQSNIPALNQFHQLIKKNNHKIKFINDDGTHVPFHIIATFNYMFDHILEEGGVYIIEDIETSYWKRGIASSHIMEYGYKHPRSVVEIFKKLVDNINNEFLSSTDKIDHNKTVDNISDSVKRMISSITFCQNCIIIVKKTSDEYIYDHRWYRFSGNV